MGMPPFAALSCFVINAYKWWYVQKNGHESVKTLLCVSDCWLHFHPIDNNYSNTITATFHLTQGQDRRKTYRTMYFLSLSLSLFPSLVSRFIITNNITVDISY